MKTILRFLVFTSIVLGASVSLRGYAEPMTLEQQLCRYQLGDEPEKRPGRDIILSLREENGVVYAKLSLRNDSLTSYYKGILYLDGFSDHAFFICDEFYNKASFKGAIAEPAGFLTHGQDKSYVAQEAVVQIQPNTWFSNEFILSDYYDIPSSWRKLYVRYDFAGGALAQITRSGGEPSPTPTASPTPTLSTRLDSALLTNDYVLLSYTGAVGKVVFTSMGKIYDGEKKALYTVWRVRNATEAAINARVYAYKQSFTASYTIPAKTEFFVRSPIVDSPATHKVDWNGGSQTKAAGNQAFSYGTLVSPSQVGKLP